jgi:hypothetical protein
VAMIELTDGGLAVGDTIRIKGHTTDFTQQVTSMQVDKKEVPQADQGASAGIRVAGVARDHDIVYKVTA